MKNIANKKLLEEVVEVWLSLISNEGKEMSLEEKIMKSWIKTNFDFKGLSFLFHFRREFSLVVDAGAGGFAR